MTTLSQRQAIRHWLAHGHSLTPLEALKKFGCLRLSGRILELRKQGWEIATYMVRTKDGKRVASYRLQA